LIEGKEREQALGNDHHYMLEEWTCEREEERRRSDREEGQRGEEGKVRENKAERESVCERERVARCPLSPYRPILPSFLDPTTKTCPFSVMSAAWNTPQSTC